MFTSLHQYRAHIIFSVVAFGMLLSFDFVINWPRVNYEHRAIEALGETESFDSLIQRYTMLDRETALADFVAHYVVDDSPPITDEPALVEVPEPSKRFRQLSLEQQSSQRGLLPSLYIGEYRYRLAAVFGDTQNMATLQRTHIEDDGDTFISLTKGDALGPYRVVSVEHRLIILQYMPSELEVMQAEPVQVKLQLFLPVSHAANSD